MVSIILINYKQKDLLEACVKFIVKHVHSVQYEIIVVNNCNDDLSMLVIDEIKIIKNEIKDFHRRIILLLQKRDSNIFYF